MVFDLPGLKRKINHYSRAPGVLVFKLLIKYIYIFLFQDKLLTKLEENEPELASSQEDEVSKLSLIKRFSFKIYLENGEKILRLI